MLGEARRFAESTSAAAPPPTLGVTTGLGPLPAWKREADFLFVQVGFSLERLLSWRASVEFDGPVYAGVLVVPSVAMARKLSAAIPQLSVPESITSRIERDHDAGVDIACELVTGLRDARVIEGVHLIPVSRYRDVAARLERILGH
jgi:methylenetetrahydrofolate reductase (NADPH)